MALSALRGGYRSYSDYRATARLRQSAKTPVGEQLAITNLFGSLHQLLIKRWWDMAAKCRLSTYGSFTAQPSDTKRAGLYARSLCNWISTKS